MHGKRGLLGVAVALAFLLSSGILAYQLVTAPPGAAPVGGIGPASVTAPTPAAAPTGAGVTAPAAPAPAAAPAPSPAALAQLPPTVVAQLHQDGFTSTVLAGSDVPDCVANSYGQTQAFLRDHRCIGVRRVLLDVRGPGPGEALVAVALARMGSEDSAAELKAVLDRPGSGNINSLNPSVPFTGQYYASKIDHSTVVNADVHPLVPGMTPDALGKIATDALG
jgi:hypothetical protein